jgi:hypothetical protein
MHRFIEENCSDFGMKYFKGLSADMDDLLDKKGQKQAEDYFNELLYNIQNDICRQHNHDLQAHCKAIHCLI